MITNRSRRVIDEGSGLNSSFEVAQRTYKLKYEFHFSAIMPACPLAREPDCLCKPHASRPLRRRLASGGRGRQLIVPTMVRMMVLMMVQMDYGTRQACRWRCAASVNSDLGMRTETDKLGHEIRLCVFNTKLK